MLKGKKILLGITGSIAAYKTPYLVRFLIKEGAEVQVVMTPNAVDFVTPLTLSTLSRRPALVKGFDPTDGKWNSHVEMGNWADLMLIAPVTATTLGKMVNGIADNLLIATYLAAKCPVYFAPAMDLDMYRHASTKANVNKLISFGNKLISPNEGELASGLCGAGRMKEPENIVKIIIDDIKKKNQLENKTALVTAGPTYEMIDPVRFIGNNSSGQMGFAVAKELAERGCKVKLVCGPVSLSAEHPNIKRIDVVSANEMFVACKKHFKSTDICVMSAAVADFTIAKPAANKIKKSSEQKFLLELKPTIDILSYLAEEKSVYQLLVGFALETNNELDNAKKKLKNKKLDFIVLNSLNDKGAGFGHKTNKVTFIDRNNKTQKFGLKLKTEVASDIADKIAEMLNS
jgi:phosphopantothenoylcysteine decarboxylase/phosphopantothenate--cysteine ligase